MDRVRIVFTRPANQSVALDTTIVFPAASDTLDLNLVLDIQGATEQFDLSLSLLDPNGLVVFQSGPTRITATTGLPTAPVAPVFVYTGIGRNAAGVRFLTSPAQAFFGDTALFTAEAFDSSGVTIPGTPLVWTTSDPARASVPDDAQGRLIAGISRGGVTVTASLFPVSLTTPPPSATRPLIIQPRPSAIVVQGGNNQTGAVGSALVQQVTARVNAADNLGVQGVIVAFAVTAGGGTLSALLDTTDANGDAAVTWTLGASLGAQAVSATAVGVTGATTSFAATGVPGAARRLTFTAQPAAAGAGLPITPGVVVAAQDTFGNTVPGFTGSVTMALGSNPGGATLGGTTTVAAVAGVATFGNLIVSSAAAGYTLVASGTGLVSATSAAFTVAPLGASQLQFDVQPATTIAGAAIAPAIQVSLRDVNGFVVTGSSASVSLAIQTNPAGGTLSGTATVAAVNGVATFSGLSIDRAAAGYVLQATSTGVPARSSAAFTIQPGAPVALAYTQPPGNVAAGAAFAPAVTVEVRDALGNVVTSATDVVTLALAANPTSDTLQGTTSVAAVAGVATFSGVSLRRAGTGYTIAATAPSRTGATSAAFTVGAGAPAALTFTQQPTTAAAGAALAPPVLVQVRDALGNPVPTATDVVTLALAANPSGDTLQGTVSTAAVGGVATFSALSLRRAAIGYTLSASAPSRTGATSATFDITPAAPQALVITQQPGNTAAGVAISPAIVVEIRDGLGNLASAATNVVTLALAANPTADTLQGTVSVAAVGGVATFNAVSLRRAAAGYTIGASAAGLSGATSTPFAIAAGPATTLSFSAQPPSSIAPNTPFNVVVTALDAGGNVATSFTGSVTLAIGTNPASGTLSGTLSGTAVAGAVSFSGLSIDNLGTGYTLAAAATGLGGAVSTPLDITTTSSANVWLNTAGGAWSTATNWSKGAAPVATDTVLISQNGTYTVTLDVNASVLRLQLGGASGTQTLLASGGRTLTVTGQADVGPLGVLTSQGGIIGGAGTIVVAGTFDLATGWFLTGGGRVQSQPGSQVLIATPTAQVIDNYTVEIGGSATWTGLSQLELRNGAVLRVLAGGTLDAQASASLNWTAGGAPLLDVRPGGTLLRSSGPSLTLNVPMQLDGAVNLLTGTVFLAQNGTAAHAGAVSIASGVVVALSAAHTFGPASSVSGAGEVRVGSGGALTPQGAFTPAITRVQGGTLTAATPLALTTVDVTNGALTVASTLDVSGAFTWTNGTLTGGGVVRVGTGATLTMSGAANQILTGAAIENSGTATFATTAGVFQLNNGAQFQNKPGAVFNWTGTSSFQHGFGAVPLFANQGTLSIVTTAPVTMGGVPLNNDGAVTVPASGNFALNTGTSGGTFTIGVGGVLVSPSSHVLSGTSVVGGAGEVQVTGGTLAVAGAWSITGRTRVLGGTLTFASPVTLPDPELSSGGLVTASTIDFTGTFTWTNGQLSGGGILRVPAAGTLLLTGAANQILTGFTIENSGTTSFTTTAGVFQLNNGAQFQNKPGAAFNWTGTSSFQHGFGAVPLFANQATVTITTTTPVTMGGVPLNNDGTVTVPASGNFALNTGTSGGTFTIGAGGALVSPSSHVLSGTSVVGGAGEVQVTGGTLAVAGAWSITGRTRVLGGTLTFAAPVTLPDPELSSGGLVTASTIDFTGTFTWTNGQLSGGGILRVPSAGTLLLTGAANQILTGFTIENSGTTSFTTTAGVFQLNNGAQFQNKPGAAFNWTGTSSFQHGFGAVPLFANQATVTITTTTPVTMGGVPLNNDGTLTVPASGNFTLNNGTSGGTFTLGAGSVLVSPSSHVLSGTSVVGGAGEVQVTGGALAPSGAWSITGRTRVLGGTLTFAAPVTLVDPELSSGGLVTTSTIDYSGTFTWTNGQLSGGGILRVPAAGALLLTGAANQILTGTTVENSGTTTFATTVGVFQLNNGAQFQNKPGATFVWSGSSSLQFGFGSRPTLDNQGTLVHSGSGTVAMGGVQLTSGPASVLTAQAGTLQLDGFGSLNGSATATSGALALTAGDYSLSGNLLLTGNLSLSGSAAFDNFNGHTATITGALTLTGNSRVDMTGATDSLIVGGDVAWTTGSGFVTLSAGTLLVGGNFTQGGSPVGFPASGTHRTVFTGAGAQTITFGTPGGAGASHFQVLELRGSGAFSMAQPVFALGQLVTPAGVTPTVFGNGNALNVVGLDVDGLVLDNAPLVSSGGVIARFDNATMQNHAATATPLTIAHPGAAAPFTFSNVRWLVTPSGPGRYLALTDAVADANVLTVNLAAPVTPTSGPAATSQSGGAVANWPAIPAQVRTWTGAVSGDWFTPGNWSGGAVPIAADSVVIPTSPPNQPVLTSGGVTIASLTVQGGSNLDLNGFTLTATEDLDAAGASIFGGTVIVAGATGQVSLRGSLTALTLQRDAVLNGPLSVGGVLTVNGAAARLAIGPFSATVGGDLNISSGALLEMSDPLSQLTVGGNATFDGGDESGLLSDGLLVLNNNVSQLATSSAASFSVSGTVVRLAGSGAQSVSFQTPGTGVAASHFDALEFAHGGVVTLTTPVFAATMQQASGTVTSATARLTVAGAVTFTQSTATLSVRALDVGGTLSTLGAAYTVDTTIFSGGTAQAELFVPNVPLVNVVISGFGNWLNGPSLITGSLTVSGSLNVDDGTIVTGGDFATTGSGTIKIVNGEVVTVGGNATFGGGVQTGLLTSGVLAVAGDFTQVANSKAFTPGNQFRVTFYGNGPQSVAFAHPGSSYLHDVAFDDNKTTGDLTFTTDVHVTGDLNLSAAPVNTAAPGHVITLHNGAITTGSGAFTAAQLLIRGQPSGLPSVLTMPVTIDSGAVVLASILVVGGDVHVTGSSSDAPSLTVAGPSGGLSTASNLLVDGAASFGMTGGSVSVGGNATFAGSVASTGLTAGALSIAGNFSQSGHAQSFAASQTHVTLLSGSAAQTVTFGSSGSGVAGSHFMDLIVNNSAAPVGIASAGMVVERDLAIVAGTLSGPATLVRVDSATTLGLGTTLSLNGLEYFENPTIAPGATYSVVNAIILGGTLATPLAAATDVPYQNVTVRGVVDWSGSGTTASVGGNLVIDGAAARLIISGDNVETVAGDLTLSNGGTLVMASGDNLTVTGNAVFAGGDQTGLLTDGVLRVRGNFSQTSGSSATSFVAAPAFETSFDGTAAQQVSFATPGPAASRFGKLRVANASAGGVVLTSSVVATGALLDGGAAIETIHSAGLTLTASGVTVDGLAFDNTPFILLDSALGGAFQGDNVSFLNMNAAADQFTILMRTGQSRSMASPMFGTVPGTGHYVVAQWPAGGSGSAPTLTFSGSPSPTGATGVPASLTPAGPFGSAVLNWSGGFGAATQLVITQQPTAAASLQAITPPITVEVRDAQNNLVANSSVLVTASLASGPSGSALGGTTAVAAVNGVATFSNLTLDLVGAYVLQFDAPSLPAVLSAGFNITAGAGVSLGFSTQPPASTIFQAPFGVAVTALDASGNVATGFTGPVSLAIGVNPAGGTLAGTTTVNAVAGVATFSGVSIDNIGAGYRLAASGLGGATSNAMAVTAPASANAWINTAGGTWSTAANWSKGTVPNTTDTVFIRQSGTYTVTLDVSATPLRLDVGAPSGVQTLSVGGGNTLTFGAGTHTLRANSRVSGAGTMVVGAGSVAVDGPWSFTGATQVSGGTLNYNAGSGSTGTMTVSSGTLGGSGLLSVNGAMSWTGGALQGGGGTVRVQSSGSLSIAGGPKDLRDGFGLEQASATGGWTSGNILSGNGGRLSVLAGGVLTVNANVNFTRTYGGATTSLANHGTLTITGTHLLGMQDSLDNTGTINLSGSDTLRFTGSSYTARLTGTVNVPGSLGVLEFNGPTVELAGGFNATGSGKSRLVTGTLNGPTADSAAFTTLEISGGTLGGGGVVRVGTLLNWTNGSLNGAVTTRVLPTATLTMGGGTGKELRNGHVIDFDGASGTWASGGIGAGNGARLVVRPARTLAVTSDVAFANTFGGAHSAIVNQGTLQISGGSTLTMSDSMANTGTVTIAGANDTLRFIGSGYSAVLGGSVSVGAASGALEINGPTVALAAGFAASGAGPARLVLGTLTAPSADSASFVQLDVSGGTLTGTNGVVRVATQFTWTGGILSGSVTTRVLPTATLTLAGTNKLLQTGHRIDFDGASGAWSAGNFQTGGGSQLSVRAGRTLAVTGDVSWSRTFGGAATAIVNQGTLAISGSSTLTMADSLASSGAITLAGAGDTLKQTSTVAAASLSGTLSAPSGAALEVNGQVVNLQPGFAMTGAGVARLVAGSINGPAGDSASIASLLVSGGTLGGTGSVVRIGTLFTWTGGTLSGTAATTRVLPGAAMTLSGASMRLDTARLEYGGTAGTWSLGSIEASNAGRFTVLSGASLNVTGDVIFNRFSVGAANGLGNQGTIAISGGSTLRMADSLNSSGTITLAGSNDSLRLTLGGLNYVLGGAISAGAGSVVAASGPTVVLGGNLAMSGAGLFAVTAGTLNLSGRTMAVAGDFTVSSSGNLVMTNAADSLDVAGNVSFGGGSGVLNNGVIRVSGNVTQVGTGTTYAPSGPHRLVLGGGQAQSVTFGTTTSSFFRRLDVNKSAGAVTLASNVRVGRLRVVSSSALGGAFRLFTDTVISPNVGHTITPLALEIAALLADSGGTGFAPDTVVFTGASPTIPRNAVAGQDYAYKSIRVSQSSGIALAGGRLVLANDLVATTGLLSLNGQKVVVGGNFRATGTGGLRMQSAADSLGVTGNATFSGSATTGNLTNGVLSLRGNFTQTGTTTFQATIAHVMEFAGGAVQTVSFATPISGGTGSHFQTLRLAKSGGSLSLASNVFADSQLTTTSTGTVTSSNAVLAVQGANASGITFDNTQLVMGNAGALTAFNSITFQNMNTGVVQFDLTRSSGSFTFTGHTYATVPSTGKYIRLSGGATVTMSGASPASGFALSTVVGGTLNW